MSENQNFSYYQYQVSLGYQVYIRFEDTDFEALLVEPLEILGFQKVEREKVKDIVYRPFQTKILKVVKATHRAAKQISIKQFSGFSQGLESLSQMGTYSVYKYHDIGMMIFGEGNYIWELGLKSTHNHEVIRAIFTRYISFALASQGVVGFWGVPVDEGFVVMSGKQSQNEALFVDIDKDVLITYDGVKNLNGVVQILRLDSSMKNEVRRMKKEELLSFLSTNTTHLSYTGLETGLREAIYDLCDIAEGQIYPEDNFSPRLEAMESKV